MLTLILTLTILTQLTMLPLDTYLNLIKFNLRKYAVVPVLVCITVCHSSCAPISSWRRHSLLLISHLMCGNSDSNCTNLLIFTVGRALFTVVLLTALVSSL